MDTVRMFETSTIKLKIFSFNQPKKAEETNISTMEVSLEVSESESLFILFECANIVHSSKQQVQSLLTPE